MCVGNKFRYTLLSFLHFFFFFFFGGDLCKAVFKDLITFSPCFPLYSGVINDQIILIISITIAIVVATLHVVSFFFVTYVNICFMTQRRRQTFFLGVTVPSSKDIIEPI